MSNDKSSNTTRKKAKSAGGEKKSTASTSATKDKETKSVSDENENNSGKKAVNPPRPASFFSSVRSDEYRSGWDSVFGKSRKKSTRENKFEISLSNEDLSVREQQVLLKAFRRKAESEGISVDKLAKDKAAEWHLTCRFKR
tara:strand:+ start:1506 stop:1928 length:423 start_codon:yes stop_codon:yes gene_type:complete